MFKRPSIKDVARVADVHFSTVSLALRGNPRIPKETRERVEHAAKSIGYRKSKVASSLIDFRFNKMPGQRPRIAFLTNRPSETHFFERLHMRYFFEGAKRKANTLGYDLSLILLGEKALTSDQVREELNNPLYEGIVLGAVLPPFENLGIDWSRFALAMIDSRFVDPQASLITNNQLQDVRIAFRRLEEQGFQRIGLAISDVDDSITNGLFTGGYLVEQARTGRRQILKPFILKRGSHWPDLVRDLGNWLRTNQLDALLSNWGDGMQMLLRDAGFRVPEDLGFACLCISDPTPDIAGMVNNHHRVGEKAVETIAYNLKTGELGVPDCPNLEYVSSTWHPGHSGMGRSKQTEPLIPG